MIRKPSALKLRVGNELRMDKHVAQIRARAPLHGLFKSLDDRFRGGVAVGMHGDPESRGSGT